MNNKMFFILTLLIAISASAVQDQWRLEVVMEDSYDVMSVYSVGDKENKVELLKIKADSKSEGFKEAEEVYIKAQKKRYLITRWAFGVTGTETLKIYDPESKSKKEIYKLQSMPTEIKIKQNGVVFLIPTEKNVLQTEWIPQKPKEALKASDNPSAPKNP